MSFQVLSKNYRPFSNVLMQKIWTITRFKSGGKCAPHDDPVCSKETLQKQVPCPKRLPLMDADEMRPKIDSMWANPECCKDPCPDYYPRFDELYYESSDKEKRKYQQTWIACPALKIKPKKICCHDNLKYPPMEKRGPKKRPRTACPADGSRICMKKTSRKCPKILMPGCRGARDRPKCKQDRSMSDCSKECTPYPSYSECLRKEQEKIHPIECKCLDHPMMCEVWSEMRRRMTFIKR